jgi:cobalt-zinc-cadmium efflux system membrane fusion protein
MKFKLSHIVLVPNLLLAIGFAASCNRTNANQPSPQEQVSAKDGAESASHYVAPGAKGIATATARPEPIPSYLDLPAQIKAEPTRVVHVFVPAGGRITEMKVSPGDRVVRGQTLAILDSGDLARAVADYHKAVIDNRVKQEALERARFLLAHSAIARKDLQQAQGDAQMAQAEVQAARAEIQAMGVNPDDAQNQLRVVAPRSGVILDIGAAQGEFSNGLSAPQPLCTIADLSTVWAVGDLLEKDLSYVKVGDQADLTLVAYPEKTWRGRVSLISSAVDPTTRTLHLRVVLGNASTMLRPDMYGTLKVLRSTHMGFAVPTTAVIREGNSDYIYVERSPGRFSPQAVTLGGPVGENEVEILSGLKSSETIVTEGAVLLRPATQ